MHLKPIPLLIIISIALIGVASAEDWPMFRKNPEHTGYTSEKITPPLKLLWKYKTDYDVDSSPVIANGIVYVGSDGVYALDANTGELKWKSGSSARSSPAVANGIVYIGSIEKYVYAVYALDANTGELKWKYETGSYIDSSPAVANGIVYIGGGYDNCVYALDALSGELKWKYRTGDRIISSPAVANGIVYIGSYDDYVYALNASAGYLKWKYKTGDYIYSSPVIANGIVYVGSDGVYALDANTGELKWKSNCVDPSPAVANGIVYIGSYDDYVYALDANTGELKWKIGNDKESSPTVANGIVYIGFDDSYLYALDADIGKLKWKYDTGGYIWCSPAVANGIVYIGSRDNYVYAFVSEAKISEAQSAISSAQSAIASAKNIGADISNAQQLLQKAQNAYKNNQYQATINYAKQSEESAEQSKQAFLPIQSAQAVINSAKSVGADTSNAQQLLQQAQNAYKNEKYSDAINYAEQAKESANVSINIIQAKSAINSVNSIGADTSHAQQLLQQAQNAYKNEKYSDAINYAEQAEESAKNAKKTRLIQYAVAIILVILIAFGYIKATEKIREQKRIAREFQRRFKEHLELKININKNTIELGEPLDATISISNKEIIKNAEVEILNQKINFKNTNSDSESFSFKPNSIGKKTLNAKGIFKDKFGSKYKKSAEINYEVTSPKPNLILSANVPSLKVLESGKLILEMENTGYAEAENLEIKVKTSKGIKTLEFPIINSIKARSSAKLEIPFKALKDGKQSISIEVMYSDTYTEYLKKEFVVTSLNPKSDIIIEVPANVKINQAIPVKVSIKNSGIDNMVNIQLQVNGNKTETKVINPKELKEFVFNLKPTIVGNMNITADLEYTDESGKPYSHSESRQITVQPLNPKASIEIVAKQKPVMYSDIGFDIKIKNTGEDPLFNPSISISGDDLELTKKASDINKILPSKSETFNISGVFKDFGNKNISVQLEYFDELGKKYKEGEALTLRVHLPEPIIETEIEKSEEMEVNEDNPISIKLANKSRVAVKNISITAFCPSEVECNKTEIKIDKMDPETERIAPFKVKPVVAGKIDLGIFKLSFKDLEDKEYNKTISIGSVKASADAVVARSGKIKSYSRAKRIGDIIQFTIQIENHNTYDIFDVEVELHPPPNIEIVEQNNKIDHISGVKEGKVAAGTTTFTLRPMGRCIINERVEATYHYRDPVKGATIPSSITPRLITYICPNLMPKSITKKEYLNLTTKFHNAIDGYAFSEVESEQVIEVIKYEVRKDLALIEEYRMDNKYIMCFCGEAETKEKKKNIYLLSVIILKEEHHINVALSAYSDREEGITEFLKEIYERIRHNLHLQKYAKEVIKIEINKIMNIFGEVHGGVSMEGDAYGREEGVRIDKSETTNLCPNCKEAIKEHWKVCPNCTIQLK